MRASPVASQPCATTLVGFLKPRSFVQSAELCAMPMIEHLHLGLEAGNGLQSAGCGHRHDFKIRWEGVCEVPVAWFSMLVRSRLVC